MATHEMALPERRSPALGRGLIKAWFVFDALVALAPPLYWAADGQTVPILGVPAALFYFLAVNLCITASLIAAYWIDRSERGATA